MAEMRNDFQRTTEDWLLNLIGGVLKKHPALPAFDLSPDRIQDLLTLAARHEVQPIAAYGLLLSERLSGEQEKQCRKIVYMAMLRHEQMERERKRIYEILETAQILFVPLKGAVIRSLYPEPWLRTSCDIDILVKEIDRATAVLEESGYENRGRGSHDVALKSPHGITVELHFQLIETNEKVNAVLEQVWEYSHPVSPGSYMQAMEAELFYFYHIAHMSKHFLFGGFGIRSMIDTWLLNRCADWDEEKRKLLLNQGGLAVFAENVEQLSEIWFEGGQPDALLLELEAFILSGGVFGSKNNAVKLHRTKTKSTMDFLILRIFMPYDRMILKYPELKKHPVLLPVFWIRRWIELLFKSRKVKNAVGEMTMNSHLDKKSIASTKWMLQELDLL